jgi:hypothetical protein
MTEPTVEAVQNALRSALQMLQDLDAGYAWRDLHETLSGITAHAKAVGVVIEEEWED